MKFINWLSSAYDTHTKEGASARKLTSFEMNSLIAVVVLVWLYWAYTRNNWEHLEYVLYALIAFSGTCLGLTTIQKLREIKADKEVKVAEAEKDKKTDGEG